MLEIDDDEYWDDQDEEAGSEQDCGDEEEPEFLYRPGADFDEQDEEEFDTEGMEDSLLKTELARYSDELGFDEENPEEMYTIGDGTDGSDDDEAEDNDTDDDEAEDNDTDDDGSALADTSNADCVSESGGKSRLDRFTIDRKRGCCPRCEHPNTELQDYLLAKGRTARCLVCGTPLAAKHARKILKMEGAP